MSRLKRTLSLLVLLVLCSGLAAFAEDAPSSVQQEVQEFVKKVKSTKPFLTLLKVIYKLRRSFLDGATPETIMEGAIRGALFALEDPGSRYFPPEAYRATERYGTLASQFQGAFLGLDREMRLVIFNVIEGSPAEKAGLSAGDRLLRVNGKDLCFKFPEEVALQIRKSLMQGKEVKLTVAREGKTETLDISLSGNPTGELKPVTFSLKNRVGIVRVHYFGGSSVADEIRSAIRKLKLSGAEALALDLRGCTGGSIGDVKEVVEMFVGKDVKVTYCLKSLDGKPLAKGTGKGILLFTIRRNDSIDVVRIQAEKPEFPEIPLYVVTDGFTSSAGEAIAGILKDYGRAKVFGKATFGDGGIQTFAPLGGGKAISLTVAYWAFPSGRLGFEGVSPDLETGEPLDAILQDLEGRDVR